VFEGFGEVFLDAGHDGEDEVLEKGVEETGLLLVFLEDEANAVSDLVKWEVVQSIGFDQCVRLYILVLEIE
jgi:hypothetical protein